MERAMPPCSWAVLATENAGLAWCPQLKSSLQLWTPHYRGGSEVEEGLEHSSYVEWLKEPGVFSLEKRRLGGHLVTLYSSLKGGGSQVWIGLFSYITGNRTKENGLKSCQGTFRLDIRKKFLTERVIRH